LLYYTDKTKSCAELIESIQTEFSLNEKIMVIYAKALTKLGKYEKSIQVYQEILAKTTDENPDILLQVGLNYGYLNQTKLAEKWILESLQARFYSKHVEYYYLGQFLQSTSPSKAKGYYEKALVEKKDFFQAYYALLLIHLETKNKKDQLVLLEKSISKYPDISEDIKVYCQQKIKQLKTDIHFE
jgi:tetratricopeptide (TPR) repeat protein